MIVVSRKMAGLGDYTLEHPQSRSMVYPPNRSRVAHAAAASGNWTYATRLNGLGALTDNLPTWLPYLAGGVAVGALGAYLLKRRKRRR